MERDTEEIRKTCDMACVILRATNDGDDLAPEHLKLLEMSVNGFTNEAGQKELERLYVQVTEQGGYVKPWFHGVENMTIDNIGYVYYKDQCVEHYTLSWAFSHEAKQSLLELKQRCELVELQSRPVTMGTALSALDLSVKPKQAERQAPPLSR